MKKIKIKADLWRLSPNWAVAGTRGSFGSCELIFEPSPHWNNMQKRITFYRSGDGEAVSLIMNGNSACVPDEIMAYAGTAFFVLDGIDPEGRRLVSTRGELRIIDTATPGGREPKVYVASELDQLRAELESLRRELESLKRSVA